MKQVFLSTTTEFKEIDTLQPGTWINLVNPTQSESMEIASAFDIDIADLRAPLDAEEMSRITIEDEYTLIIVDVPITEERNNRTYYVTIPLGIIITEEAIITTCLEPLPLLDVFINRRLRNFYTFMRSRFIFQILYRNAEIYLTALRSIERKSEQIETQLHKSTRNEELIELMELEKTIVYFKASLKTNERVIKKLTSATSNIKKYLEDEDLLEDTLIIVDVPITEERNNRTYYVTIPLGIIITEEAIITTCLEPLPLLDIFINRRLRNFYTFMRSRFIFQILYRNAEIYLTALRSIERKSEQIETQLHKSTRNEELIELMELEKTIVYFKASLKTNERVIKKLTSATSNIKKYLEDEDLLEDTLIETQQAIEMADIYGNVLHSMTETFASIISNNQNNIMKTLALVTIVMSVPTMIFSAYGMNFKDNEIPLNGEPHAFWLIVFIAFAMSVSLTLYLIHKKWF